MLFKTTLENILLWYKLRAVFSVPHTYAVVLRISIFTLHRIYPLQASTIEGSGCIRLDKLFSQPVITKPQYPFEVGKACPLYL